MCNEHKILTTSMLARQILGIPNNLIEKVENLICCRYCDNTSEMSVGNTSLGPIDFHSQKLAK